MFGTRKYRIGELYTLQSFNPAVNVKIWAIGIVQSLKQGRTGERRAIGIVQSLKQRKSDNRNRAVFSIANDSWVVRSTNELYFKLLLVPKLLLVAEISQFLYFRYRSGSGHIWSKSNDFLVPWCSVNVLNILKCYKCSRFRITILSNYTSQTLCCTWI